MPYPSCLTILLLLSLVSISYGIKCWQCGQYSDGVGSITPCTNKTAAKLEECKAPAKYCIKYVSELTTVRDCVNTCSEKEWWGARTFCCDTDECNSALTTLPGACVLLLSTLALLFSR